MDFLVHSDLSGEYDTEVRERGSRILRCSYTSNPPRYCCSLRHMVDTYGPYDVIHSHVHYFSGIVLAVAALAKVPVRIAHSHSDTSQLPAECLEWRHVYHAAMRRSILVFATRLLSVSRQAGAALFGPTAEKDRRFGVLSCGIETGEFDLSSRETVRASFGLGRDQKVLAHVGNFRPAKNQIFAVDIMQAMIDAGHDTVLFLIGEGPTRSAVERHAATTGHQDRVRFLGLRRDVPRLLPAFDAFVFPSIYEGLPLACIEAQAAGLPTVMSDAVTEETCVVPALTKRLPLSRGASFWAAECARLLEKHHFERHAALEVVAQSRFGIRQSAKLLAATYCRDASGASELDQ